eukprot:5015036-Amphidinium_carterae.1
MHHCFRHFSCRLALQGSMTHSLDRGEVDGACGPWALSDVAGRQESQRAHQILPQTLRKSKHPGVCITLG